MEQFEPLFSALANRYAVVREVGRGGMAVVFLARDLRHDRDVAIKVLRLEFTASIASDRFLAEIRHASKLDHPRILPVLDWGNEAGFLYSVMPFIAGETLRQRIAREGQLPIPDAVRLASEIADVLAYAHTQGIIHRDIKPANILLSDGHPIVADFGIARAINEAGGDRLTSSGMVIGTPEYMSPEQGSASGRVDARGDIYSLACVVYEMLAGEPPFTGPTSQVVITRQMHEAPRSLRLIRATVPLHVEEAVAIGLSKVAADRFPDAREFAKALNGEARSVPGRHRWEKIRRPVLGSLAGAAVVAAVVFWGPLGMVRTRNGPVANTTWPLTSLAVMPIADLTPDQRYGWLVAGLTNELIDALASVPELDVRTFEAAQSAQSDARSRDSLARRLRIGSVVRGTLEQGDGNKQLTLSVRISDANSERASRAIRVVADVNRADSLRFGLVDLVAVELRKLVGARLEMARLPDRRLNREAWELYRRAEAFSRSIATDIGAGRGQAALSAFAGADTLYARASRLAPRWEAPLVGRGWLYEHHARFVSDTTQNQCLDECLSWKRAALRLLPTATRRSVAVRELRGAILVDMTRAPAIRDSASRLQAEGEAELLSAIKEDSSRTRAWIALSFSRGRRGDPHGAVAALRAAERADPWMTMEPEVLERWGTNLRAVGDFNEAARLCEVGRARYPERASFQQCRLILLGERGRGKSDIDRAWDELRLTTAASPDSSADVTWWFRRCMVAAVLARSGLKDSAYAVLAASRRIRPTQDPNLLVQESFVAVQALDTARVVQLLGQYLRHVPSATEALARERRFQSLRGAPAFDALFRSR